MRLCTLGTSHGATEQGRACSCNLLTVNGVHYLFDCGGYVEGKMVDLNLDIADIKAVFISHMHEDHVGTLTAIVKRFNHYIQNENANVKLFLPEENGLCAFKNWVNALHMVLNEKRVSYALVEEGVIYTDENIKVTAIRTQHLRNGEFPSFSYMVETEDKRFLYTGDLNPDFHDYPEILYHEEFDAVLCELVHFSVEKNMDCFLKTKTKQLIFTHMGLHNIPKIEEAIDRFPYPVHIAHDHAFYHI